MPQTPLWEEIKIHVTVTEIAEEYGDGLRRAGRLMCCRCLCGQHSDTDPSFYLYPEDNHAHCFACGWHGDVIALYMLVEGISDRWQACKAMQARYLATVPTERPKRDRQLRQLPTPAAPQTILPEVRFILELAVAHYHRQLWKQAAVLRYLHEARGLVDDTMTRMQIGYADGHSLSLALHEAGVDLALAGRIGLLRADGSGEFFSRRIIFPIFDAGGQVAFLTGRQTEAEQPPKYLHLPNTPLLKRQPMQVCSASAKHGVMQLG